MRTVVQPGRVVWRLAVTVAALVALNGLAYVLHRSPVQTAVHVTAGLPTVETTTTDLPPVPVPATAPPTSVELPPVSVPRVTTPRLPSVLTVPTVTIPVGLRPLPTGCIAPGYACPYPDTTQATLGMIDRAWITFTSETSLTYKFTVSFPGPEYNTPPLEEFVFRVYTDSPDHRPGILVNEQRLPPTVFQTSVGGLSPGTTYWVILQMLNAAGLGPGGTSDVTTPGSGPSTTTVPSSTSTSTSPASSTTTTVPTTSTSASATTTTG
jgi:hypothetical protein